MTEETCADCVSEIDRLIDYIERKAINQLQAGRGMTVGADPDVGGGYTSRLNHVEHHAYAGHVLSSLVGDLRAKLHLRTGTVSLPGAPEA